VSGVTVVDIEVAEMGAASPGRRRQAFRSQGPYSCNQRSVVLRPTRAVVFPLPIAILILLVPLMRIGVHAMANVGRRYASLDMPHAEPDLSATLLTNLKVHVAGGVIEASGNV
jgi:hypothetical protein